MEHWVYGTDDDEPPNKECSWCDDASKQHHAELKRTCAESSKPDTSDDAAVTNAPGDPSWARLEPHPENARPPPYMDPPQQHFTFAPAAVEWTPETAEDDYSYQDPSLPPGVIDISAELRWRFRERQRQRMWIDRTTPGTQLPIQPWMQQKIMAHLRVATFARAREMESSIHYPLGVMNAQLSVISIHGETITEDHIESVTLCE